MKAAIRQLHSPDIDDLKCWSPAEPECFGFLLQALVGPSDGEGEEPFDFVVCSPNGLDVSGSLEKYLKTDPALYQEERKQK